MRDKPHRIALLYVKTLFHDEDGMSAFFRQTPEQVRRWARNEAFVPFFIELATAHDIRTDLNDYCRIWWDESRGTMVRLFDCLVRKWLLAEMQSSGSGDKVVVELVRGDPLLQTLILMLHVQGYGALYRAAKRPPFKKLLADIARSTEVT